MRTLAIAALQTAPVAHDLEASWDRFAQRVRTTRELFPHVQLVVVPELFLAAEGPLLEPAPADWMHRAAVPVPGPLTDRIGALAAETGLWLVPGSLFERTPEGAVHNTALVFSPDGELVARYRKVFPWQPYEQAEPGDRFTVFEMPGVGRIGLAICYDGSFPETVRQLAWLGAEVVIQPTLTTTRDREMELVCARANAWTNQVYVVNVNTPDPYGVGHSAVVDPEGTVRQQAGPGEEALVDVLDLDAVTRVRRHGSAGINRPWAQLARYGAAIELPMYRDGVIQPPAWQQQD
ncbi:carbon-nitrogen hydrolase family protein [Kitasatospora cineracea]|uniref:Formamidase n=1 Tax=Kitasatospora cineracea TaxID=88074 RepID=A0A3N4R3H4_9ACTN|nr:carbon-nitrogen hydrolase family protein [Kitasatospora cineracea]RPE27938.1 formamidase [Kitasatospora cineracea]